MRKNERGITLIGWVCLLIPLAIIGYAAIRLTPVYLNAYKVSGALENLKKSNEGDAASVSVPQLRVELEKLFDTGYIDYPTVKDIAILKEGTGYRVTARYEDVTTLFGNISLLTKFDKQVEIH